MSIQMTTQTIQVILAPVVMVTACGQVISGLLTRYTNLSNRLRTLAHERLDLLRQANDMTLFQHERLDQLDNQLPELLHHHRAIHRSILLVYQAIAVFIVSMFAIAFTANTGSSWVATVALGLFLLGISILLLSIVLNSLEFRTSHRTTRYEVQQICHLGKMGG